MPWVRPRGGARQWCAAADFCSLGVLLREARREQPERAAWISEEVLLRSVLPFLLLPVVPVVADGGGLHTCAIRADGGLVCFGENDVGQCSVPADLGPVVSVAAGVCHTCAVKADGGLVCFGRNHAGQCFVPADLGPVLSVAAGFEHTCAVKADGSLVCFGWNRDVQCSVPADLGPVLSVAAGVSHTCAVKADGSLVCFGGNAFGQCSVPADLGPVLSVAAGLSHTCAIKADRSLVCFGENASGQCSAPADLGPVLSVAAGSEHTCAVKADGGLVCFGRNAEGQCSVPSDLGPVLSVAAGCEHTCAVKADGSVVCFGRSAEGQCSVPADLGPVARIAPRNAREGAYSTASATNGRYGATVIQEVQHREPAADIPPTEAAEVVRHQWSQSVQLLASASSASAASAGPVDLGDVGAATSAAGLPETPECLMTHACVLTKNGPRNVTELSPGDELTPGRAFHDSTVCAMRLLMRGERRVVTLYFGGADPPAAFVTLTAAHVVMVVKQGGEEQQQGQQGRLFRQTPVLATEVQPGDLARGRSRDHAVHRVEHDVQDVDVVEVQLCDTRGTFFVGMPGMTPDTYVEVCGALAPLRTSSVEILRFQRRDQFKQIILDNPELKSCVQDLEASGYSADLGTTELGPAKLLVRADQAWQVISALRQRCASKREQLKISDVVVSTEFKPVLLHEVQRLAPRANPVIHQEVLHLCGTIRERRTFLDISNESASSGVTAHSSTDAHIGVHGNPRKRGRNS